MGNGTAYPPCPCLLCTHDPLNAITVSQIIRSFIFSSNNVSSVTFHNYFFKGHLEIVSLVAQR